MGTVCHMVTTTTLRKNTPSLFADLMWYAEREPACFKLMLSKCLSGKESVSLLKLNALLIAMYERVSFEPMEVWLKGLAPVTRKSHCGKYVYVVSQK
jgi:hypothetical protein